MNRLLSTTMYFSYNQFLVFDRSVALPGQPWTQNQFDQGFTLGSGHAAFRTLLEFGTAELKVFEGRYDPQSDYESIIEVPFEVLSGELIIAGPEEFEDTRIVKMDQGTYRLNAAQKVTAEDQEQIDLFFEGTQPTLS